MKTIKTILSKTSYITLSLVVGLALAAGVTFAAYEWSTSWITTGGTISAVELKNNLDYLKSEIEGLGGGGIGGMVVYDTSGEHTFTVPATITKIKATVVGGGGGGGGVSSHGNGGGGGSGGLRFGVFTVTPNQEIVCTVGSGGSGGGYYRSGRSGSTTAFNGMIANGGGGGRGGEYDNGGSGGSAIGGLYGRNGNGGDRGRRTAAGGLSIFYGYGKGGNGGSYTGQSGITGICIIEW